MSLPESTTARRPWPAFFLNSEPAARIVVLFLMGVFALESYLLFGRAGGYPRPMLAAWGVTLLALLTVPWWSRRCAPAYPEPRWQIPATALKMVWLMAGAVAILALWPRSVRLDHGYSQDEIRSLDLAYRYSREFPVEHPDDKMEPVGARRIVAGHVTAQAASQLLKQNPRQAERLDGRRARTLPWVAGLLTVGGVVLLAAAMGSPRAGLAAGLIMAMHPQHVRLSCEVMDDSLELLGFATALLCLFQGLRTNRWRWWLALAVVQACCLALFHPGMISVPLCSLAAVIVIATNGGRLRDRFAVGLRLLPVLAIAGLGWMLPFNFAPEAGNSLLPWDGWGRMLSGVPWTADGSGAGISIGSMVGDAAWRGVVFYGLLPLCLVAGLYFMLRQDWRTRLVGILALAGIGLALNGSLPGFLLVLFPLVLVWGGVGIYRLLPDVARLAHAPLMIAVIFVVGTSPALNRMMQKPLDPLREVARAARPDANRSSSSAVLGVDGDLAKVYDPDVRLVETAAELNALADAAFENDQPLYVYEPLVLPQTGDVPRIHSELTTGGRFVAEREFHGWDGRTSYRLYRYESREQIIRLNVKPDRK